MLTVDLMPSARPDGEKIRIAREVNKLTQTELAVKAGVSLSYVQKLEKGLSGKARFAPLRAVLETLNLPMESVLPSSQDNVSATIPTASTRKSVPIYHFVPANRLGGPDDFYSEQQDYDPKMIETEVTSDRCMVIVLDGDCMEPQFPHGAKMLVDWVAVEKDGMKEGDFYFIRTRGEDNGRCTFKQYAGKDKSGRHQFRCLNPKYKGIIKFKGEFDAARAMHRIL